MPQELNGTCALGDSCVCDWSEPAKIVGCDNFRTTPDPKEIARQQAIHGLGLMDEALAALPKQEQNEIKYVPSAELAIVYTSMQIAAREGQ